MYFIRNVFLFAGMVFISLATSCVGLQEEEGPQTVLPHILYMDISYSRKRANNREHANRTSNSTQSINLSTPSLPNVREVEVALSLIPRSNLQ